MVLVWLPYSHRCCTGALPLYTVIWSTVYGVDGGRGPFLTPQSQFLQSLLVFEGEAKMGFPFAMISFPPSLLYTSIQGPEKKIPS